MTGGTREVIDRWVGAMEANDFDTQDALLHDDFIEEWPQSGERIVGRVNRRAIVQNYPGATDEMAPRLERIVGAEDRWEVGPMFNLLRVAGSGDEYAIAGHFSYPNGELWHGVMLIRLRDNRIWRITSYFGPPFEAAAWRAGWVELVAERPL